MKEIFQHPLKAKKENSTQITHIPEIPEKYFIMLEEMRERKITGRATQGANIIGTESSEHIKNPSQNSPKNFSVKEETFFLLLGKKHTV